MGSNYTPASYKPDFDAELIRRHHIYQVLKLHPEEIDKMYGDNPVKFVEDFCWGYNPRAELKEVPFIPFERQRDLIRFLHDINENNCNGLIEKSRDMGASFIAIFYAIWAWRFRSASVGFGSRKEATLDVAGNMDSLFEKIRWSLKMLPGFMLPPGFTMKKHSKNKSISNPDTLGSITGELGEDIGRGGRTSFFVKDESAHWLNQEKTDAALTDNTEVSLDISSVNGSGNLFYRTRMSGSEWCAEKGILEPNKTQIFVMDWSSSPWKDQAWYDDRLQKAIDKGTEANHHQEVSRNYSASVMGTIIKDIWVKAAIGLKNDYPDIDFSGYKRAALDVGDDGLSGDKNALAIFEGLSLEHVETWGLLDTAETAGNAYHFCKEWNVNELQYDSIGIGAGVKGSLNALRTNNEIPESFEFCAWVASAKPENPDDEVNEDDEEDSTTNAEQFANRKAQAWWATRERFRQSYLCREGKPFDESRVISINPDIGKAMIQTITTELSQAVRKPSTSGKYLVDKAPNNSRSPNAGDAIVMGAFPVDQPYFNSSELIL